MMMTAFMTLLTEKDNDEDDFDDQNYNDSHDACGHGSDNKDLDDDEKVEKRSTLK